MGAVKFNAGGIMQWISIHPGGEKKYSKLLHATETGKSSGLMSHLYRLNLIMEAIVYL